MPPGRAIIHRDLLGGLRAGGAFPILLISAAYLAIGVAALASWQITGDVKWVERFFRAPGAIVLVWLALVQFWMSTRVLSNYSSGEPMYWAWLLISGSALIDVAGTVLIQVLGFDPVWRRLGHAFGGTMRFSLLAAGLFWALKVHRQAGFPGRPALWQWFLVSTGAGYVVLEAAGVVLAVRGGKEPTPSEMLGWPVDPLLCILLAQAFMLRNAGKQMGEGFISRSWKAITTGIFLVLLGNAGGMAEAYGYLPWPWSSITWYVWIPAACAFAMAPALQLDTIRRANAAAARA